MPQQSNCKGQSVRKPSRDNQPRGQLLPHRTRLRGKLRGANRPITVVKGGLCTSAPQGDKTPLRVQDPRAKHQQAKTEPEYNPYKIRSKLI